MAGFTPTVLLMFFGSIGFQVLGISLLPITKGFTQPLPSFFAASGFALGIFLLARVANTGVNLSTLIPLMSTLIPLCSVGIGVLVYGESASLLQIAMLVFACGLIGTASALA